MKLKRRSALAREEMIYGYGIVSLWFIGFILFTAGPILASLFLSFTNWEILSPPSWVGTKNYITMFSDDELFWRSLYNTAYYTILFVPLQVAGAVVISLALSQETKCTPLLRAIYFLPSVLPGIAATLLWMYLFQPDYGVANWLLERLGLPKILWLQDVRTAKETLVIMGVWGLGGSMPIFLGGIRSIPRQLYEAAKIDGAGDLACFRWVTIPMLTPMVFFSIVTTIIHSFQVFASAYIATNGGPENSTLFYVLLLYRNAFSYFKMGYASAMAWFLFLILLLATLIQFWLSRKWVYYEAK